MEQIPFINYPGSIATAINELIKINPSLFLNIWQISGMLFTFLLAVIVFLNFSDTEFLKGRLKKILTSPLLLLIITTAGIFILRLPNLILPEQNFDESQWIVNAASWLNGSVIWKDVSGITGGPLLFVPLSIMFYIGEGLNYASVRMFGLIICILPTIFFVYLTFKIRFNKETASLLILPLLLLFAFTNSNDFIAYESELIPMLLTAICIYLFISWQLNNSLSKLLFSGLILGCFPYAKLQAVPIALLLVLCTLFELILSKNISNKQKINSIIIFISGGLIPTALLFIYLYQNNNILNFLNNYFLQNLNYTQPALSINNSTNNKILIPFIIAIKTPETIWFFGTFGITCFLCIFMLISTRIKIKVEEKRLAVFLLLILIGAYVSLALPGGYFIHYGSLLIVPYLIFTGFIIGYTIQYQKQNSIYKKIILFWILIFAISPIYFSFYSGNKGIDFIRNGGNYKISEVANEISKYSIPNEKLAIWGWNHKFYVETGLTQGTCNANSYYEASNALRNDNSYLEKYIANLKENQPVIFLDASQPQFTGFKNQIGLGHENFKLLNDFINKNYTLVSEINQKKIYVLNERLIRMGIL